MRKVKPFALLTLLLLPACGVTKQTLIASTQLRERITEFGTFLSETMPGSATTTIRDRAGTNTLIVLVNLSPDNIPRWTLTASLTKYRKPGDQYALYFKAARRISDYVLGNTISEAKILMPRLLLAFYIDDEKKYTWYDYSLQNVMEPLDSRALPIEPNVGYHLEWGCLGPFFTEIHDRPQLHCSNNPQYMVASITHSLQ
jgi:hypothetical protein